MFLYSYHVYFTLWNKSKKRVREKNRKFNLWSLWSLHSLFKKIISHKGPNIYDVHMERGREVLKFVTCLQILLFLNNRSVANLCRLVWVDGWGLACKRHNCMIPNIKTCFDKKVTFLALVPVLQWNSSPRFIIYVRSQWKVT